MEDLRGAAANHRRRHLEAEANCSRGRSTSAGNSTDSPKVTYEAKDAMREIQDRVWRIDWKIEPQTEITLKGIAFEARRRAKEDFDDPVWRGIAEAADRRREILTRYRTGAGTWYACVELTRWDIGRSGGEITKMVHEQCNSKKEAEETAQRLLAEHAKYFTVETSVEAGIVCELEWEDD
ncbi:hypothetical protein JQ633_33430 [Bradyrhizobium tropiciagri]|uniref:hypothetical protein n=1 Tax=Bradyrhizobium tropiciagri TaxID=312253 RepID=UPI001BA7A7AF|nr:hypothetical protein [Bradyrhizobium tropiciagri]MBR0875302.1 hypothetical protein [Bradyrhizobium tropiciagri]